MKNRYNPIFASALSLVMLLTCSSPVSAMDIERIEKQALPADQITTFEAAAIDGSYMVKPGDKDEILLKITREIRGVTEDEAEQVLAAMKTEFNADGDTVYLREDHPKNAKEWEKATGLRNVEFEVLYELWIPESIDLNLSTIEGDVAVGKMSAVCRVSTVEGDVMIEEAGKLAEVSSVEGDVMVTKVAGTAKVSTVEGDVMIREVAAFQAQTVEGDVMIRLTTQPSGNCRLNTVEGDAQVTISPDLAVSIVGQTLGGKTILDLPLEDKVTTGGQVVGNRNGGGPSIHLNSVGGDIVIK